MLSVRPGYLEFTKDHFAQFTQPVTLLTLRHNFRDLFYPQDWYDDEDFANAELPAGKHIIEISRGVDFTQQENPPAVVCAAAFVILALNKDYILWPGAYVWTSDRDFEGNRVYVGGYYLSRKPGFEVHRELEPLILNAGWYVDNQDLTMLL